MCNKLEICDRTVVDWTNFCRELLFDWLMNEQQQLGGPGIIVEVDEVKIGKRKFYKGRLVKGQWIFGGIERVTRKVFIVPVENRRSETLLTLITKYIAPRSIIYSDCWRGYTALENDNNYVHKTVNHSENFVDPNTNVHTQNIERLWRELRSNIPRFGTREYHYNHYIAEFLFKRVYAFDKLIDAFFEIMSKLYPINN
nr:PREDICTED: uncharacterized protein LOC105663194 [Megachile rotundata]